MSRPAGGVVLELRDLHAQLSTRWGVVRAVDGVSLTVREGETLGLVGESGSGKTMTALAVLRLLPEPAGRIVSGQILLEGEDLVVKTEREMEQVRGRRVSMILQDPQTSLNPVFNVGNQIVEALRVHRRDRAVGPGPDRAVGSWRSEGRAGLWRRAEELLERVRVAAAAARLRAFPHQISGGTSSAWSGPSPSRASRGCSSPTSRPPRSTRRSRLQYLRLLKEIQRETGLAMLFITHDFGIVARMCDRVAVMYAGRDRGDRADVRDAVRSPSHPYTAALLGSVPRMERAPSGCHRSTGSRRLLHALPPGCRFAPRCRYAEGALRGVPARLSGGPRPRGVAAGGRSAEAACVVSEPLLRVAISASTSRSRVGCWLSRTAGQVRAVDGVGFTIGQARRSSLVGESGCGKTTTRPPRAAASRSRRAAAVLLDGRDVQHDARAGAARVPGAVQAVFQDPWSLAEPADARGRDHRRAAHRHTRACGPARQAARRSSCWARSACAPAGGDALPARVQRRPAPAHRAGAARSRLPS